MNPRLTNKDNIVSVQDRVFDTIEEQGIEPRSRYVFMCVAALVWVLWVISVVFGAMAAAVLMNIVLYRYYDLYEIFASSLFVFVFKGLPLIWVVAFVAMIYVAMKQLRRTTTGYRYPTALLALSSVVVSLFAGLWLHTYGFGWWLDAKLDSYTGYYPSQTDHETKLWQNPASGRLVGRPATELTATSTVVPFKDMDNADWELNINNLSTTDRALLDSGDQIRILGAIDTEFDTVFHACNVFAWTMGKPYSRSEIKEKRVEYITKIYGHMDQYNAKMKAYEQAQGTNIDMPMPTMGVCAEMTAIERISKGMR